MKSYFCPCCGRSYESSECDRSSESFGGGVRCPACDRRVELSGAALITVGLLTCLFSGLVLNTLMPPLGAGCAVVLVGVGVTRVVRQFCVLRRARSVVGKR
jgi:hypothetical protein